MYWQSAYEESDNDCCVYRQLEKVSLNLKTGIAKKGINGAKVSQQSLFYYFVNIKRKHRLNKKYPNFTIESSVSAELISYLCKDIERNMYGYIFVLLFCEFKVFYINNRIFLKKLFAWDCRDSCSWGNFACNQFKFM